MTKRVLLLLTALVMVLTMLSACKSNQEEEAFGDVAGGDFGVEQGKDDPSDDTDKDTTDDKNNTDTDQKDDPADDKDTTVSGNDQNDNTQSDQPSDGGNSTQNSNNNTNKDPDQGGDNDSSSSSSSIATLTNLQNAGTAFNMKAGQTVWFGPIAMNQETALTAGGKAVGVSALTEVAKLGGGYRLYSYKATADGAVTISAPGGLEDRFLISLEQTMTATEYNHHFDKNGVQIYHYVLDGTGKTLSWNGKETTSSDYAASHPISVQKGDTLSFGPCVYSQVVQGYGYDAKGKATTLINASNLTMSADMGNGWAMFTYTVPEDVASVRIVASTDVKTKFAVCKNKVLDANGYSALTGLNASGLPDVLKGRAGLFAGDSINHGLSSRDEMANTFKDGKGGWAARVERDTGLVATNVGESGYHFTDVASNYGPINDLLKFNMTKDFDYVILQGGVNDAPKKVPLGEISDSFDLKSFNTSTFAGGFERTLYNAVKYHGDTAAIAFIVTFKIPKNGTSVEAYYDIAKKICDKWGVSYLDLYNNEKLNADLKYDTFEHTNDGVHPDASGYELITPYVTEWMRTVKPCPQEVLDAVLG